MHDSDDTLWRRVSGFLAGGDSIPYDGIVVSPNPARGRVEVLSYLDENQTDRPSDEEAWSKIDHSRRVVEVLKTKYPSLQSALGEATLRFSLCRDYGKGAYAVAEVKGDKLVWISV